MKGGYTVTTKDGIEVVAIPAPIWTSFLLDMEEALEDVDDESAQRVFELLESMREWSL